jgi:hypothetical protein
VLGMKRGNKSKCIVGDYISSYTYEDENELQVVDNNFIAKTKSTIQGMSPSFVNFKTGKVTVVELPFAFIKKLMHYTETRYLGMQKKAQHVYLIAAAYNLRRIPNLKV